ncbi:MAG: two-component regulator propeller domain-containing protein [bacterium]
MTGLHLICALSILGAQPSNPSINLAERVRFERLAIAQGLSQNTVLCILQDYKGFMWFGTGEGLNKYDGYSFTVYKHDPSDSTSLSANYVEVTAILQTEFMTQPLNPNQKSSSTPDQFSASFRRPAFRES